jgi:hypothetical protein
MFKVTLKFALIFSAMMGLSFAAPTKIAKVKTRYIGLGNINLQHAASNVVNVPNLTVKDAVQNIRKSLLYVALLFFTTNFHYFFYI